MTPGFSLSPTSRVPSLKGGRKVVAMNGTDAAATTVVSAPTISTCLGRFNTACKAGW